MGLAEVGLLIVPGPLHAYVTPVVRPDVTVKVANDVGAQVICPVTEALAPGNVLFSVTVAFAVDLQPVAVFVTVTV